MRPATSSQLNRPDHLTVRFNVNNVFDEEYIASLNNNGGRYTPGAGRSFILSADFDF